jgi:hypothetical protein
MSNALNTSKQVRFGTKWSWEAKGEANGRKVWVAFPGPRGTDAYRISFERDRDGAWKYIADQYDFVWVALPESRFDSAGSAAAACVAFHEKCLADRKARGVR